MSKENANLFLLLTGKLSAKKAYFPLNGNCEWWEKMKIRENWKVTEEMREWSLNHHLLMLNEKSYNGEGLIKGRPFFFNVLPCYLILIKKFWEIFNLQCKFYIKI